MPTSPMITRRRVLQGVAAASLACGVPLVLRATYWGGKRDRVFHVLVDGEHPGEFIERDYAIPERLLEGRQLVRIRFQPETGHTPAPCSAAGSCRQVPVCECGASTGLDSGEPRSRR
jgi:hypothetical protein